MKHLHVLHITDLHYCKDRMVIGDVKDKSVSTNISDAVCYENIPELFFNTISDMLHSNKVDVIACTGDIGNGKEFSKTIPLGMQYLAKLAKKLGVKAKNVLVSPGNHDLNRKSKRKKELDLFCKECEDKGFRFATRDHALCVKIKGLSFVALNSCLGGTEHTMSEYPKEIWAEAQKVINTIEVDWEKLTKSLAPNLRLHIESLDIPAVGKTQTNELIDYLRSNNGNCAVVLAHHTPAASPNIEIRPYASLIDSGPLLSRLATSKQRIIYLHGHAHCDSASTTYSPEEREGFVAAIGCNGLHGYGGPSANIIRIILDDRGNFLAANISRILQRGASWVNSASFQIFDRSFGGSKSKVSFDNLDANVGIPFEQAAKIVGESSNDAFAETLLRAAGDVKLQVANINRPISEWVVTKTEN